MKVQVLNYLGAKYDRESALITDVGGRYASLVATAWDRAPIPVVFRPGAAIAEAGFMPLGLFDQPDVDGAEGYHDKDDKGAPYAKVFLSTIPGGETLHDASGTGRSLAAVVMHELAEAIMDTLANLWVQMNFVDPESGRAYNEGAFELCDWCQNSAFTLKAADGTVVDCSDFCLPTFFNPDASGEKLTYMGTIDTPGMVAPGGYGIVRCAASESEIFGRLRRRVSKRIFHGEKPPEWREKMFHVKKHSRTKRRLGT